jgi:DNA-binding MarR family transcriptional regulator
MSSTSATPSEPNLTPAQEAKLLEIAQSCVCFNMRRGARAVTQYFDALFQEYGLRATQFTLLGALAIAEKQTIALSITQIADLLVMDRSTLTRNLQPLERDGLVTVELGTDRRTRVALLTGAGRTRLAQVIEQWEKGQSHFATLLGQSQLNELLQQIRTVVEVAQK